MLKKISNKYNKKYEENILELLESIKDLDFKYSFGCDKSIMYEEDTNRYIVISFFNSGKLNKIVIGERSRKKKYIYDIDIKYKYFTEINWTEIPKTKVINNIIKKLHDKYYIGYFSGDKEYRKLKNLEEIL